MFQYILAFVIGSLLWCDGDPLNNGVRAHEYDCNEYVCGSIVSKCLLTQSCQCKLSDCHCCKDCLRCLGELYTECCGCLDMCPKRNDTIDGLTPRSQVGNFDGVPELFEVLTADEEDDEWTVLRFPMRSSLRRPFEFVTNFDAIDRPSSYQRSSTGVNCTVIYLHSCQRNSKCAQYCESMGASSYRWFHDGCCECVGAYCFNYGINESRCAECPERESEVLAMDGLHTNEDNYVDENDDDVDEDTEGVADAAGNKDRKRKTNDDDDVANDADDDDEALWTYGEDEINYN